MIYALNVVAVIHNNYIYYSVSSTVVPRFVLGVSENYRTVIMKQIKQIL